MKLDCEKYPILWVNLGLTNEVIAAFKLVPFFDVNDRGRTALAGTTQVVVAAATFAHQVTFGLHDVPVTTGRF